MVASTPYMFVTPTNLGPLTAIFTAPASCTGTAIGGGPDVLWRFGAPYGEPVCQYSTAFECLPSGEKIKSIHQSRQPHVQYYSPGLVCPAGWTTVEKMIGPDGSAIRTQTPDYPADASPIT